MDRVRRHGNRIVINFFLRPPRAHEKDIAFSVLTACCNQRSSPMSKITSAAFALLLLLFFGNNSGSYAAQSTQNNSDRPSGTLQTMIVENGSVSMNLDLNRLNGISSTSQDLQQARFAVGANS